MDWLKNILQSLPLDKISDILGEIVIWWSQLVKDVPPADLPMYAYLGGSILVLLLWILVARMLPRPLGGMSWMVLFAVLLAPGSALSDPGVIAPASISVVYAIMMKDIAAAVTNALPILVVLVVGLFIGFVWQLIRGAFDSSLDKARQRSAEDAQANMQLATGNYLASRPDLGELNKQNEQAVTFKTTPTTKTTPPTASKTPEKGFFTKVVSKESKETPKASVAQKVIAKARKSNKPSTAKSTTADIEATTSAAKNDPKDSSKDFNDSKL